MDQLSIPINSNCFAYAVIIWYVIGLQELRFCRLLNRKKRKDRKLVSRNQHLHDLKIKTDTDYPDCNDEVSIFRLATLKSKQVTVVFHLLFVELNCSLGRLSLSFYLSIYM